jgi:hypothetical protein
MGAGLVSLDGPREKTAQRKKYKEERKTNGGSHGGMTWA